MNSSIPMTLAATLITTFTAIPNAYADVNMMEASYQTQFTDLEIGGLKITRLYNSRSNFSGLFGFGWCSTFDTHLEFSTTPQGRAFSAINECGRLSNVGDAQFLKFENGFYSQTLSTGLTRKFDAATGELVSLQAARNPEVRILRARPRLPRDAALGEGLKMRLEFDDLNERVVHLETPDKQLEFTYAADRTLLSARNAWSNTYRFTYDTLQNLTMVRYPDDTSESMTYDADHDRLLSFQGRQGHCTETYSHTFSSAAGNEPLKRTQVSTAKLICKTLSGLDVVKRAVRFDFSFTKQSKPKSKWMLSQLSLTRDGKTQSTKFYTTPRGTK